MSQHSPHTWETNRKKERNGNTMCHTFAFPSASASGVGIGHYVCLSDVCVSGMWFFYAASHSLFLLPSLSLTLSPPLFLCFPSVLFSVLFIPFLLALRTFVASLSPAFVRFLVSFILRLFHVSYFTGCVLRQCVQQQSTILNGSESPTTSASPTVSTSVSASVSASVSPSSTLMRLKRQFSWNRWKPQMVLLYLGQEIRVSWRHNGIVLWRILCY